MGNFTLGIFVALSIAVGISSAGRLDALFEETLDFAVRTYESVVAEDMPSLGQYPHTGKPENEHWTTTDTQFWTVGFFPGVLWQLYRLTGGHQWATFASYTQAGIRHREYDTGTHDVGFVIMSSFGLGLRSPGFENNEGWKTTVVNAAKSLSTRFVENAKIMRSWSHSGKPKEVTVIVDNMMNLDLMYQASVYSGNPRYAEIATIHADTTLANHFRPDHSSFHVVAYNEDDGHIMRKYTAQGYKDDSAWSRGQAWAMLGYIETFEWTADKKYLTAATNMAMYFINNLNSTDYVPFWDFDAGREADTEYQPRDTSAATIAALAMLKIAAVNPTDSLFFETSEKIIESVILNYSAKNSPIPALSVNGTVFRLNGDFDTAIIYGDMYLLKYIELYKAFN